MFNKLNHFINSRLAGKSERSANAVKNIIASFGIKGVSIAVQLLLVPMTINYVNPTQYGIWLTLSSIIGWFSFFDIGFGNGLRNRFAEAKATGDFQRAKAYVSTTYICIGVIFAVVWLLFFSVNFFLDWSKILNAPAQMAQELSVVALIVISFFCLQMVFKLINTVLTADQKPAKSAFFDMLGQILALTIIFILTKTTQGSFIYLALVLGFCPIAVMVVSSWWFYNHEYKQYKPAAKLFERGIVRDIVGLGSKFFVAQIAAIVIYQSANLIIAQLFSPEKVTEYNIAYRYFSIPHMLLMIILAPMWSAYTDAYSRQDTVWMLNTIKKLRHTFVLMLILSTIMLFVSSFVYRIWIGNVVTIPFEYSLCIYLYTVLYMWISTHIYVINGIGKVHLQYMFSMAEIILFVPLSVLLGRTFGVCGVISSMIVFVLIRSIWSPIQVNKLIRGNARGIWNQ